MKLNLAPVFALLISTGLLAATAQPSLAAHPGDRGTEIRFRAQLMNDADVPGAQQRRVHPGFAHLSGWVSAVGASVGAVDFDGNHVADEACLVDPRDDSVRVIPIPGSASSQEPLALTPVTPAPAPSAPMGCLPADVNQDGVEDVVVYYWGRSPVIFYQRSDGGVEPVELVAPAQVWNSSTAGFADVDGNGAPDLLIANYFPDDARVLDPNAADDQRMEMQDSMSLARNAGANRLYLSDGVDAEGRATLRDVSSRLPEDSARGWTLAVGFQDLTGDRLPEMYVANDFGPDQLLVNNSKPGDVHFVAAQASKRWDEAKSSRMGHDSFKGMGVDFTTLPGTREPSIVVSNITQEYGLQESNFLYRPRPETPADLVRGHATYDQVSEAYGIARSGWSWDVRVADFNADGLDEVVQATGFVRGEVNRWAELQELAMGNDALLHTAPAWFRIQEGDDLSGRNVNRLWCLQPDQSRFRDCGGSSGVNTDTPTRAFSVTDFDADGRQDLLEGNQWAPSVVRRNETDGPLGLIVSPERSLPGGGTTAALGATVVVVGVGGVEQTRQLYTAQGHAASSSPELAFAAAPTLAARAVRVSWRAADGTLREGEGQLPGQGRVRVILHDDGRMETR